MHKCDRPIEGVQIKDRMTVEDIVRQMGGTAFQARNLGHAADVWRRMLADPTTTVFLGLAGAMVPAGMRSTICTALENHMVDVCVSTGANLYHDIHEALGGHHWQGDASADDRKLGRDMIDRIYDVYASEEAFQETDHAIAKISARMGERRMTTRQYLDRLGRAVSSGKSRDGVVSTAAREGIPLFCPAIADSSLGISMVLARRELGRCPRLDLVADIEEITEIVTRSESTGVIYVGGGTPKNYIQQTQVVAKLLGNDRGGHRYAIQITTDAPHWGGLSGCTLEESISWGKVSPRARMATVHSDATIAFPLLVAAVLGSAKSETWERPKRSFDYLRP